MISCAVKATGHAQYRNINVMCRSLDIGLLARHLACFFSTFAIYLEFISGNHVVDVCYTSGLTYDFFRSSNLTPSDL